MNVYEFRERLNRAMEKGQNISSVSRAKEDIGVILKQLAEKEHYQLFFQEVIRAVHSTPITERRFAFYCIGEAATKLGQNVRSFLPQIMKYTIQRLQDPEDDMAYYAIIAKAVNVITKAVYAPKSTLMDVYGQASSTKRAQMSFSTVFVEQPTLYSGNEALNQIVSPLVGLLQAGNCVAQRNAAQCLLEAVYVAQSEDLEQFAPILSETVLLEAEKKHEGVRKELEVFLIQLLIELYKKFAPVLAEHIDPVRLMKLVKFCLGSREYQIRTAGIRLAEQLVLQKIIDQDQVQQVNALAAKAKFDTNPTTRQAAVELFQCSKPFDAKDATPKKTQRPSFKDFLKSRPQSSMQETMGEPDVTIVRSKREIEEEENRRRAEEELRLKEQEELRRREEEEAAERCAEEEGRLREEARRKQEEVEKEQRKIREEREDALRKRQQELELRAAEEEEEAARAAEAHQREQETLRHRAEQQQKLQELEALDAARDAGRQQPEEPQPLSKAPASAPAGHYKIDKAAAPYAEYPCNVFDQIAIRGIAQQTRPQKAAIRRFISHTIEELSKMQQNTITPFDFFELPAAAKEQNELEKNLLQIAQRAKNERTYKRDLLGFLMRTPPELGGCSAAFLDFLLGKLCDFVKDGFAEQLFGWVDALCRAPLTGRQVQLMLEALGRIPLESRQWAAAVQLRRALEEKARR